MKIHHSFLAMLCMAMPLLQGCGNDDLPAIEETGTTVRASLSIGCASKGNISRATSPSFESGSAAEEAISSAYVIIYDKPMNSSDAANGKVVKVIDLTSHLIGPTTPNLKETLYWYNYNNQAVQVSPTNQYISQRYDVEEIWLAEELKSLGEGRTLYAIALANINPVTAGIAQDMTVAALRDLEYTGDLYTHPSTVETDDGTVAVPDYKFTYNTDFVMSGINETKFSTTPVNGKIDLGTLMVQRLAARLDIAFGDQATFQDGTTLESYVNGTSGKQYDVYKMNDNSYQFPIYDEAEYQAGHGDVRITGAYFYLWDIQILNPVDKGMYLFEHATGTPNYLGNEGAWDQNATSGGYFARNNITSVAVANRTYSTDNKRILSAKTGSVQPYHVIFNNLSIDTQNRVFPFQYTSVLGYMGENTFDTYVATNKYTTLRLGGITNLSSGHIEGTTDSSHGSVAVEIPIRHSFGAIPDPIPANAYGVVRNTIYRIYVKFYAQGDEIYARYYYYNGNGTNGYTQNTYDSTKFHSFILESNGTTGPSND